MTVHPFLRVSETYPTPTLVNGEPQGWHPSSVITEEWGTFRVELGGFHVYGQTPVTGSDVTVVRGARTLVTALSFGEPGGEGPGSMTFPAIKSLEDLDTVFPWTRTGTLVDVWHVLPGGASEVPYWAGRVGTRRISTTLGLVLQVIGAFTGETGTRKHQPWFRSEELDIGSALARDLDPTTHARPIPGYSFLFESATTGITTRKCGSRSQYVLDFVGELLAMAQDSLGQWTIARAYGGTPSVPQPRKYYLRRKGTTASTLIVGETGAPELTVNAGGTYPGNPPDWTGTGGVDATLALSMTHAHTAVQSLQCTFPDQSGSGYSPMVTIDYWQLWTPEVGVAYTLGVWVWVVAGGSPVIVTCGENGYPGDPIRATSSTTGGWEFLTLPASTVIEASYLSVQLADPTLPTTVYVDGATMWQGNVIQENTVSARGRGVTDDLVDDALESPNVIYGEGVDPTDHGKWRNAKFPGLHPRTPPAFPGILEFPDADPIYGHDWISRVQASMRADGLPDVTVNGFYDFDTVTAVAEVQRLAGLPIDGATIDSDTWDAIWTIETGTTFTQSYFSPLAWDQAVEPYLYYSDGSYRGDNPLFNRQILRVEETLSYGESCRKGTAQADSGHRLRRETAYGPWAGTITLDGVSPEERHAFDIREGGILRYRYFMGSGVTGEPFYISGVAVNPETRTVTLTVDQKPYDILALSEKIARNKESRTDPARSLTSMRNRTSKPFADAVGWDKESGAGHIPPVDLAAGWNLIRYIGEEIGSVLAFRARTTNPPTRFAMALFADEVEASQLETWVPNPLADPAPLSSWWNEPSIQGQLDMFGFIESWGEYGHACGYWPANESDPVTPDTTGGFLDKEPLSIASFDPPFMSLLVWAEEACTFNGDQRITVTEN